MAVSSKASQKINAGVEGKPTNVKKKNVATATDLDRVIHERTRLALVSALAAHPMLSFNDLKATLAISDGNLSAHARKLEDAGYVDCQKSFEGRVPRTQFSLTAKGKVALQKYIAHMEALILAVKKT